MEKEENKMIKKNKISISALILAIFVGSALLISLGLCADALVRFILANNYRTANPDATSVVINYPTPYGLIVASVITIIFVIFMIIYIIVSAKKNKLTKF